MDPVSTSPQTAQQTSQQTPVPPVRDRVSGTPLASWESDLQLDRLATLLVPGLGLRPASDRAAWAGPDSLADPATLAEAVRRADAVRGTDWAMTRATDAARYHLDGNRTAYERAAFDRIQRLAVAALAAAAEPTAERVGEVADGLWLLCEQSTWCWPAHDDAHERRGWVLPDVQAPFLDLGAGEVAAALAWTDALLGDLLEEQLPGLRERMRSEVDRRVLTPFLERGDWHWLGIDRPAHNWTAWIAGNVLVASLAFEADPLRRAQQVRLAVAALGRFLDVLPPDGAIDEGYSYWWQGAARALEALDVLRDATGGALDAARLPLLRDLVAFPHRMRLGHGWVASFSDASPRADGEGNPWHVLHRWGVLVGDADAAGLAAQARVDATGARLPAVDLSAQPPGLGVGRVLLGAGDPAWRDAEAGRVPLAPSVWLPSTQILLTRAATDERGLAMLVKGGHNGEAHNHLDVGTVSLAVDGVPVVVDLGRATYTAVTFGPDRYTEWHIGSAWHCVPAPAGATQRVGAAAAAREVVPDEDDAGLRMDLAQVYDGVAHWRRHARRVSADLVEVSEDWRLSEPGAEPTRIGWVLSGAVRMDGEDRVVVRPRAGERHLVIEVPAGATATLVERELTDPYLRAAWGEQITRLDLVPPPGVTSLTTRFLLA